ncbi:MAG: GntR family transcriptional regulator [Beijerinckiaceae bacterium]|nr:GntR family transcriptional regulator [Beijerinckiaceae bacterium]
MSRTVELAYDFIYGAIASGRLRPGDHVPEEMIAAELRVSRTPVREAIRRLETEGLVVITRNSGADIVLFGPEDIIETFRLRAMLEGYAAERAASRVDAHGLEELDALVARMSGLRTGADLLSATRVNAAFHLRIAEAADSARLYALIRGLVHTPLALMHSNGWAAQLDGARGFDEHARIVDALRNRDADLARALMQTHILGARPKLAEEAAAQAASPDARKLALNR